MPKQYRQACPVAKSVELLGERWTLLVVRDLLPGARRFGDLQESLPGIAPNVLSARLQTLEEHGIVARRFYSEHPPRAEYVLTERGRELGMVVGALAVWGSRHLHRQSALVHGECETPLEVGYFCPHCQGRVRSNAVKLRRPSPRRSPRPPAAPRG
jgi:DNA-binding HxlR family transcriptional regulator